MLSSLTSEIPGIGSHETIRERLKPRSKTAQTFSDLSGLVSAVRKHPNIVELSKKLCAFTNTKPVGFVFKPNKSRNIRLCASYNICKLVIGKLHSIGIFPISHKVVPPVISWSINPKSIDLYRFV